MFKKKINVSNKKHNIILKNNLVNFKSKFIKVKYFYFNKINITSF